MLDFELVLLEIAQVFCCKSSLAGDSSFEDVVNACDDVKTSKNSSPL